MRVQKHIAQRLSRTPSLKCRHIQADPFSYAGQIIASSADRTWVAFRICPLYACFSIRL